MPATLKDVAARAGVSTSAVSRTFTQGASVSSKMRNKVEKAAKDLGYRPNALASSLTTGRTKLVGLISNNFKNPVFLEIFDLFTKGLQDRGLRPLLVNLSDETDPAHSVDMLRQYSVDGVVVASSTLPVAFSEAFLSAAIPVVHSFGQFSANTSVPSVCVADIECGRMAARTLIARGYRDIGFLGGPQSASTTQDRLSGFLEVCAAHPEVKARHSFSDGYAFSAGQNAMQMELSQSPAEAYFCGDDVMAIGALAALKTSRLSCPEDIGLLGLNDMEIAGWDNIALTTIRQPIKDIVEASVDLMTSMLEDPARAAQTRVFPCSIVERGTLRPLKSS